MDERLACDERGKDLLGESSACADPADKTGDTSERLAVHDPVTHSLVDNRVGEKCGAECVVQAAPPVVSGSHVESSGFVNEFFREDVADRCILDRLQSCLDAGDRGS